MTCSMDGEQKNGLTEVAMKATTKMVASMVMEVTCGQMDQSIQEIGLKTRFMVAVIMNGQMEELTRGIGLKIIWTALVPTHGQTVVFIQVNIAKAASMARGLTLGQTAVNTQVNGEMVGKMAGEHTNKIQRNNLAKESGQKANVRNGFETNPSLIFFHRATSIQRHQIAIHIY